MDRDCLFSGVLFYVGWRPTPARGFHPVPHNAHALSALRLRRGFFDEHARKSFQTSNSTERKHLLSGILV